MTPTNPQQEAQTSEARHTPRELLQECMESAVRLAFIRHSEDIEFDADADTQEEIANDAACACFAEGTCTEEPIEEVAIALKRLEAFDDVLAALKELTNTAIVLCADYLSVFDQKRDDETVQGWDVGRWRRLLKVHTKAKEVIAKAEKQP